MGWRETKATKVITISIIFLFLLFPLSRVAKAADGSIDATVKIGVCGNDLGEANEECDGVDYRGKSCSSIGMQGGPVFCDISCSIDYSNCEPIPVPPPKPQIPAPTPTSPEEEVVLEETFSPLTNIIQAKRLPSLIGSFDTNGDDFLDAEEMVLFLTDWVKEWSSGGETKNCDINGSNQCDLVDLSVLLYWIGR
jgi:hypothetical protein